MIASTVPAVLHCYVAFSNGTCLTRLIRRLLGRRLFLPAQTCLVYYTEKPPVARDSLGPVLGWKSAATPLQAEEAIETTMRQAALESTCAFINEDFPRRRHDDECNWPYIQSQTNIKLPHDIALYPPVSAMLPTKYIAIEHQSILAVGIECHLFVVSPGLSKCLPSPAFLCHIFE